MTNSSTKDARQAAIDAVQEEFDERGLGDADLIADVILDAAHDPQLGPNRSVNAQQHRAEVIAEVVDWLAHKDDYYANRAADMIEAQFGTP